MAYSITWQIERRVIYLNIYGKFTGEELIECSQEINDRLSQGEAPVHIVCDVSDVTEYPRNIASIKAGSKVYLTHPSMGWFIFVGFDQPIMRFLSNTIMQVMMRNFKHARSLNNALEILQRVDVTLQTDPAPVIM